MDNLDYAIKLEKDGQLFYEKQAELNKDNFLYNVCMMIAQDEENHAAVLENLKNKEEIHMLPSVVGDDKTIFEGLDNLSMEEKETLSQFDFYHIASDMELETIRLYEEYKEKSENEEVKKLFEFLVEEEKKHFRIMDGLSEALRKSQEWIENAEFGVRPEY